MADRRQQSRWTGAAIQAVLVLIISMLSLIRFGDGMYFFEYLDVRFQDELFRLRNRFSTQPIADDLTLIGIDDNTLIKLGAYGKGQWAVRIPFIRQISFFRLFRPKVVAYDIMFLETRSEQQRLADAEGDGTAANLKKVEAFLQEMQRMGGVQDPSKYLDVIQLLSHLTGKVSDSAMAFQLSNLLGEESSVILAYHLPVQRHNQIRKWNQEDILGPDEDDPHEDNGLTLPYLRDVSIPTSCARNIPSDYQFNDYRAKLPSARLLDFGQLGFINGPRDKDGVVRRLPLVYGLSYSFTDPETQKEVKRRFFVPSIALLSCLQYWNIDLYELQGLMADASEPVIEIVFGNCIKVRKPDGQLVRIPIDDYGFYYIDFVGKALDFRNISFNHVGRYEEMQPYLKDRIVFVGATMTGATDIGPTPLEENSPLVITHMNIASNILTDTHIRPLRGWRRLILYFAFAMVFIPFGALLRPRWLSVVSVCGLIVYLVTVYGGIHFHKWVLPITGPVLFLVSAYIVVVVLHYLTEEREKQLIRGMFSTMVSGDVLTYIEENPGSFSLAGEQREATMFFSDLAGFTSISESLSPEDLVKLLNAYLTPMTEIILNSDGYVDKYEGDAIMAEWGVPFADPDHAKQACWSALDQQAELAAIREPLRQRFGHDLYVRMGLNSGVVSAGNMGSERRFSYTVMGDAVNQAARFEPANKDYDTEIMIGESTYQLARDNIEARLLDKIVVKGKTVPITIYELLAKAGELDEAKRKMVKLYEKALRTHWDRDFQAALELLDQALKLDPDDGPSRALRQRIQVYLTEPPPDSWQGQYIRLTKD